MDYHVAGGYDALSVTGIWAGVRVTSDVDTLLATPQDPGELKLDATIAHRGIVLTIIEIGHAPQFAPTAPMARAFAGSVVTTSGVLQVVDGLGVVACAARTQPGTVNYEVWLGRGEDGYARVAIVILADAGAQPGGRPRGGPTPSVFGDEAIVSMDRDGFGLLETQSRWPLEIVVQKGLRPPYGSEKSSLLGTVVVEPDPTSTVQVQFFESRRRKLPPSLIEVGRVELHGEFPLLGIRGNFGEIQFQALRGGRAESVTVVADRDRFPHHVGVWVTPVA